MELEVGAQEIRVLRWHHQRQIEGLNFLQRLEHRLVRREHQGVAAILGVLAKLIGQQELVEDRGGHEDRLPQAHGQREDVVGVAPRPFTHLREQCVVLIFSIGKAVFNLAIREFEVVMSNPFARIDMPAQPQRIDQRLPLPPELISTMYEELHDNLDLLDVWTLIHHTGAQSAEILGLKGTDIVLSDPVHLIIRPNEFRGVKAIVRDRKVPLIGRALEVAQRRLANINNYDGPIFPKYALSKRHDSFSGSINKRLRKHTDEKKHVCYGLRHNMKDSLIEVGATKRQQDAILGHSMGTSASEGYGSRPKLADLEEILKRIDFGQTYAS